MSESMAPPAASADGDLLLPCGDVSSATRFLPVAVVMAGAWGAVEITLGGFLHALRVPFVGLVMSLLQAGFFIAVRRVYPMRGLLAASGALAAVVKLMVPSGALLSPSVGILVEGILLESAFLVLPGAWAAPVGACLALLWSIFQMVGAQVVLFGWDLLALYALVIESAFGSWGSMVPRVAGVVVFLGVVVLGGTVGMWARALGGRLARELSSPVSERVSQVAALRARMARAGKTRNQAFGGGPQPVGWARDGGKGPGAMSRPEYAIVVVSSLLALASLAHPGLLSVAGFALLTVVLGTIRRAYLVRLMRWRFWLAAAVVAFATGLALTLPRLPYSGREWTIGALSAAGLLLVRVALLSEIAVVAVELLRPLPRHLGRLGAAGYVMAETWSILPDALGLIEMELESARDRSQRWERLRCLPGIVESLMVWALLVADERVHRDSVDAVGMESG